MKNKHLIIVLCVILAISSALLYACDFGSSDDIETHHVDRDSNGICDLCGETIRCAHVDDNNDFLCDLCERHFHHDFNTDGKCDSCSITIGVCIHENNDGDYFCDKCGERVRDCEHEDANGDFICDKCTDHVHADKNTDGKCDGCGEVIGECSHVNEDGDDFCDKCGGRLKACEHIDVDMDCACDKCGEHVHADKNTDGKCDGCGEVIGECSHEDTNTDGKCDKCGKIVGECAHVDLNADDICDKCDARLDVACVHIDLDDNGYCDKCEESVIVTINFYAINDIHGTLGKTSSNKGVGGLTYYLNSKKQTENTVVLSSGDTWQGSTESNNTKGALATEWLNYIDCESMTLGNHEFDWSTDKIKQNATLAEFPLLAINVYERATNQQVSYCSSSVVVERDGVKIGIIGAIGDCYSSISSSMCKDVYFKVGSELTALVKAESERLRTEEKVDFVVYSLHDGYDSSNNGNVSSISDSAMSAYYDAVLSDGYVDLVFEAHTHQRYVLTDSHGVYHLQGGGYNKGISYAGVSVNVANDNTSVDEAKFISYSTYANGQEDDIIDELSEKYKDQIGNPDSVLGYNSTKRYSDTLEQTVAELYYKKGVEQWGATYDIVLGGGFLKTRTPYNLDAGNVTMRTLQALFPFDNKIVLCSISGKDLKSKYFSLPNNYSIYYEDYGTQVKNSLVDGKTYYIVTDTYSSDYHKLMVVSSLGDDVFARDLLADYISAGGYS